MIRDRFATVLPGPPIAVSGFGDALARVRAVFPDAYAEGSMGSERTFYVRGRLVAHAWGANALAEVNMLRIAAPGYQFRGFVRCQGPGDDPGGGQGMID